MNDQVLTSVQGIFAKTFQIDPASVSLETTANDIPAWDSVGHLSLCGLLEETFDIRLDVEDITDLDSVHAIVSRIHAKQRAAAAA
jgi:acyl carrier protein